MIIRNETSSDVQAISDITVAAFADCPYSRCTEQFIVTALRAAGAMTISLVAELDGKVVGHIAFSPITISDGSGGWFGLGPISVTPRLQRKGIGKAMMNEGLTQLKAMGAKGCVLIGDPNYYKQFGFKSIPEITHEGVPQENVLVLPFGKTIPCGAATFHQAFMATS